ncbi:HNH endonuclease [Anaerophaga thermohalophila]|uniref:HNH endonuclease n=1 Tax=Anaerophaga thermohalophila TaxID=177400 RepID=UPI0002D9D3DF|nr:HNH endonuclease [Anaerophaga thermohalophila]
MVESYWNEEWKEIPFEKGALRKRYAVSNYGRVVSYCTDDMSDAAFVKGGTLKGYKTLPLRPFGRSRTYYVHKLVAEQFIGKDSDDQKYVIHLDYNKCNNFVENLCWANKKDMFEHQQKNPTVVEGRKRLKENRRSEGGKLTDTQVMLLKKRISDPRRKTRLKIIARQFGISEIQLHRIKRGENWAHIQVNEPEVAGDKK